MSAHTPGPWTAEKALRSGYWISSTIDVVVDTDDEEGRYGLIVGDNAEANARLIASAPDLLEALEACELRLTHLAQNSHDVVRELKQARAAIAKAVGHE